ncbi:MAG: beta-N-acetylhexosaminidase [Clostridiaceae bacterium]|nr:beta-N-acetylhexosaminidase [Clostridiaceae bacterium]
MKLKLFGDIGHVQKGVDMLADRLGYEVGNVGLSIHVQKHEGDLIIKKNANDITIQYEEIIHFYRALGLMLERVSEEEFEIRETPQFKTNGVMLDLSRGLVLKVKAIKEILEHMALMGLNMVMLYTEDTYVIEDEPYFGYMRGRYTQEELRQCDDYAAIFGIEIIPCIQTLGHMEQFLKWPDAKKYGDTPNVLLADNEETYAFIEKAIQTASAPFRSNRIHIGMDEANNLGLGRYLDIHGFQNRFEIMNRHLNRVSEIAEENGLKPMIWSDMYFALSSKTGMWYESDGVLEDSVIEGIPKNTDFIYWDYYHENESFYVDFKRKQKAMGKLPIFAGGIWIWTSYGADYDKTFSTTNAAMAACKKEGVSEVMATIWANAAESSFSSSLLGFQLFAEHGYAEELDMEKLKRRVKFCTGISYEEFYSLTKLYKLPGQENQFLEPPNPASCLLWQDPLMGLYDAEIQGLQVAEHFEETAEAFTKIIEKSKLHRHIFETPKALCDVLKNKGDLGIRLKTAYDENNKAELHKISETEIPELVKKVYILRDAHRRQWHSWNKAFGYEICDVRYGGVIMRLDSTKERIQDYISGKIDKIEELSEERLPYYGEEPSKYAPRWMVYKQISTAYR